MDYVKMIAVQFLRRCEKAGITQKQLSEKSGVTQANISRWKRGKVKYPSKVFLEKLEQAYKDLTN